MGDYFDGTRKAADGLFAGKRSAEGCEELPVPVNEVGLNETSVTPPGNPETLNAIVQLPLPLKFPVTVNWTWLPGVTGFGLCPETPGLLTFVASVKVSWAVEATPVATR